MAFEKVTFALDPKREGLLHNKGICTEATLRSSRPDAWLKMLKKPLLKRGHSWPFVGGLPLVFVLGLGCTNLQRGEAFWNFAIPPQDVLSQLVFSGLVATLLRRRRPMEPSSGTAHDRTDQQVMSAQSSQAPLAVPERMEGESGGPNYCCASTAGAKGGDSSAAQWCSSQSTCREPWSR